MIYAVDPLLLMSDDKTKFIPGMDLLHEKEPEDIESLLKLIGITLKRWLKKIINYRRHTK